MSCNKAHRPLRQLIRQSDQNATLPTFLAPALLSLVLRPFSTSSPSNSRVGKAPISIPTEVSLRLFDLPKVNTRSRKTDAPKSAFEVVGPMGQMTLPIPPYLIPTLDQAGKRVTLAVQDSSQSHQRAMWGIATIARSDDDGGANLGIGTIRSHLQNYVTGVSENHICILRLVGVGYRASIENSAVTKQPDFPGQKFVSLKLGFAHPVEVGIPLGVKASCPQPIRILLEGCDKEAVTLLAAEIRAWRKPEPYKGKGIFVNDETIKLKAKKIK